MRAIFISDLHLAPHDAITQARFDAFLREDVQGADQLYICGDLLHVWLGDRMLPHDNYVRQITAALKQLADNGTQIFLVRGNRDFMMGEAFAKAAGATLLAEQTVITLDGRRMLLMHGDELCIDDVRYQRARRFLRTTAFRRFGDALPAPFRRWIARKLRGASDSHKSITAMQIMDANAQAIDDSMLRHGVRLLIHGHTHRPQHETRADRRERWVLSDWQQDFGYLEWQDGKFHVRPWPSTPSEVSI